MNEVASIYSHLWCVCGVPAGGTSEQGVCGLCVVCVWLWGMAGRDSRLHDLSTW